MGRFPFELADAGQNLPFIQAYNALQLTLAQAARDYVFTCRPIDAGKRCFLRKLLDDSKTVLSWHDCWIRFAGACGYAIGPRMKCA